MFVGRKGRVIIPRISFGLCSSNGSFHYSAVPVRERKEAEITLTIRITLAIDKSVSRLKRREFSIEKYTLSQLSILRRMTKTMFH